MTADGLRLHVSVERSVARVVAEGADGRRLVGMAFAVGDHMVTCAHVVNEALGRHLKDHSPPAEDVVIRLEFPSSSAGRPRVRYANVTKWLPSDNRLWHNLYDIAVLELDKNDPIPADVVRVELGQPGYQYAVRLCGVSGDRGHEVVLAGTLMGWSEQGLKVDVHDTKFAVGPGFSGGPVWLADSGRVVGMVVAGATGQPPADLYLVPSDVLGRELDPPVVRDDLVIKPKVHVPDDRDHDTPVPVDPPPGDDVPADPPQLITPGPPVKRWWAVLANPWLVVVPAVVGLVAGLQAAATVTDGRAVQHSVKVAVAVWGVGAIGVAGAAAMRAYRSRAAEPPAARHQMEGG